jgi:hypothetical protein
MWLESKWLQLEDIMLSAQRHKGYMVSLIDGTYPKINICIKSIMIV